MTTLEYDDRDVEFTGVLSQRLKPGEDPSWKLPKLYEALGVETAEEAVLALARIRVEGFKPERLPRRKRARPGRPRLLSTMSEARGFCIDGPLWPDWFLADLEERLFSRMETLITESTDRGRPMKVSDAAFCVIDEEEFGGQRNAWRVGRSIARGEREQFAKSVGELFTHRERRRKQHTMARQTSRESAEQERERELWKLVLPGILEGMDRAIQEAVESKAAGERAEDILADLRKRAIGIANDIIKRVM